MKIFDNDGHELCDLPDKPKNFDCGHKAGVIDIFCGGENIKLGRYSPEIAERIISDIGKAYRNDQPEFTMPLEGQVPFTLHPSPLQRRIDYDEGTTPALV